MALTCLFFLQHFSKEFDKTFGKGGAKLFDMKHDAFRKASDSLQESISKEQKKEKEPGNLKEYSPWMSNFKPEVLRNELEIPGLCLQAEVTENAATEAMGMSLYAWLCSFFHVLLVVVAYVRIVRLNSLQSLSNGFLLY